MEENIKREREEQRKDQKRREEELIQLQPQEQHCSGKVFVQHFGNKNPQCRGKKLKDTVQRMVVVF